MVPDSRLGLQQVKESKTIGCSEDGTICEHLLQPNNVLTVVGNGALSTYVVYTLRVRSRVGHVTI